MIWRKFYFKTHWTWTQNIPPLDQFYGIYDSFSLLVHGDNQKVDLLRIAGFEVFQWDLEMKLFADGKLLGD